MTDTRDDLRDLQMHRSILRAYVRVLERTDELFAVCAATTGDATARREPAERAKWISARACLPDLGEGRGSPT